MYSNPVYETYYGSKRSGADIEEKMARELQKMKLGNEAKQKEVEKVCAESEEIRQLKEKIKAAYVSKERAAQIAETQIRKLEDIVYLLFLKDFNRELFRNEMLKLMILFFNIINNHGKKSKNKRMNVA